LVVIEAGRRRTRRTAAATRAIGLAAALLCVAGCSSVEEAPPRPRNTAVSPTVLPNIPEIMRGTVASQAVMAGYADRDVVVHGYGLVVGLKGTGHRILDAGVRAHMLGEMARMGVGRPGADMAASPEELLDSPDTAVVVVQAIIPPGAPRGTTFDVRVEALPGTETTSLEGGRLWTTELRPALGRGLPPVGSRQARPVAAARGEVFTNPFVVYAGTNEGGVEQAAGTAINLRSGHVLGGGVSLRDMPLRLRLVSPSHNTAANLQQIINTYFPQEPGQRKKTAHALDDSSIEITVPPSYTKRTREFVHLVQHLTLFVPSIEPVVAKINADLRSSPSDANHAAWRWQALGPAALPGVKVFYDSAEELPRFAALQTGARLSDPLVVPHLLNLANTASPGIRRDAIGLMADMRTEPRIVMGLKDLLDADDVDVRIAAYESLAKHGTALVQSIDVDGKFVVDYVESKHPLVYVTLLERPRIVVFGERPSLQTPLTLITWGDRLMLRADAGESMVDVHYRDPAGEVLQHSAPTDLRDFIPFLGHTTTIEAPAKGLGLSYSETVGVLWAIHREGLLPGAFRTERDRIFTAIQELDDDAEVYEARPEFNQLLEETAPPENDADTIQPGRDEFAPLNERPLGMLPGYDMRGAA